MQVLECTKRADDRRADALLTAWVFSLALLLRLLAFAIFPTRPISDFAAIVEFAQHMAQQGAFAPGWFWQFLNPGTSLLLAPLVHYAPGPAIGTAALSTIFVCSLVPAITVLLLRAVTSFRTRAIAGLLLACWPGAVLFSAVVAQDNWILLPALPLACLAVRAARTDSGFPVAAALLVFACTAIRQEMLLPALLLGAVASGLRRGAIRFGAVTLGGLLLLMGMRFAATRQVALKSSHASLAVLGAYVPGAVSNYWIDPRSYLAGRDPSLQGNEQRMQREASRHLLAEIGRRPGFHILRIWGAASRFSLSSDADNLYWSQTAAGVLPDSHAPRAAAFVHRATPWLRFGLYVLHALFIAAVVIALMVRDRAAIVIAAAAAVKAGIHFVTIPQSRFFVIVAALELLAIAVAWDLWPQVAVKRAAAALLAGIVAMSLIVLTDPGTQALVQRLDRIGP